MIDVTNFDQLQKLCATEFYLIPCYYIKKFYFTILKRKKEKGLLYKIITCILRPCSTRIT